MIYLLRKINQNNYKPIRINKIIKNNKINRYSKSLKKKYKKKQIYKVKI